MAESITWDASTAGSVLCLAALIYLVALRRGFRPGIPG